MGRAPRDGSPTVTLTPPQTIGQMISEEIDPPPAPIVVSTGASVAPIPRPNTLPLSPNPPTVPAPVAPQRTGLWLHIDVGILIVSIMFAIIFGAFGLVIYDHIHNHFGHHHGSVIP